MSTGARAGTSATLRGDGSNDVVDWTTVDGCRVHRVRHVPDGAARAVLVVCSPVAAEFDDDYRREVLLGRRLAAEGVLVVRFHPRGTGNSDGDPADLSFTTMLRDTAELLASARGEVDGPTGLLGTSLSALVAAQAARDARAAAVILWQPPLTGRAYFREAARSRQVLQIAEPTADGGASPILKVPDALERDGWVDIAGYAVHRRLHDSFVDVALDAPFASGTRVELLQWGRTELDPRLAAVGTDWEHGGAIVTSTTIPDAETWWFRSGPLGVAEELRPGVTGAIDAAAAVMAACTGDGGAP